MLKFIHLKSEAHGIENKAFEKERTIEKKTKTLGKCLFFSFLSFFWSPSFFSLYSLNDICLCVRLDPLSHLLSFSRVPLLIYRLCVAQKHATHLPAGQISTIFWFWVESRHDNEDQVEAATDQVLLSRSQSVRHMQTKTTRASIWQSNWY